jgi:hypothetical protein
MYSTYRVTTHTSNTAKGDTLSGYSTSTSSSKYPTNGASGSYWYVYQGSDSIDPTAVSYSTTSPKGGEAITIKVTESSSNTYGGTISYVYQYSTDGGSSWTTLTTATSTSASYTIPAGTTQFQARVYAKDNYGFTSSTYVTGSNLTVQNNTAPTLSGSITVPSTIKGGDTISISWSAASDSDGNLSGYTVQRSIDGGSSWTQIYQGSNTSTTDTAGTTWSTVMYRVQAYDSWGATSSWISSSSRTVIQNEAPDDISTISVPDLIGGATARITWSATTDPDNNLTGYILERSVDSASYTQIYKGANTYYDDTITKGWQTVSYRVKAYDSYGEESGYTTSTAYSVNNNETPTISGADSDLGVVAGFSYVYSVNDANTDQTLTVTVSLDGTQVESFQATRNTNYTYTIAEEDWLQLKPTSHTVVIKVDDANGGVATRTITFSREQKSLSVTLISPFECDEMATRMYATVSGSFPSGCVFKFYASNNAFDTSPVWQDVTDEVQMKKKFYFSNTTKTASKWGVSLKLEVERGEVPEGTAIQLYRIEGGYDGYST